jgi:arsenate reductase (thioredoxin)
MPRVQKVLILCTGNSARRQMAEGLFRMAGGDRYEVFSAGTKPSQVRLEAIAVMRESGIDISAHYSKSSRRVSRAGAGLVITVCDNAKESCPVFPGRTQRIPLDPGSTRKAYQIVPRQRSVKLLRAAAARPRRVVYAGHVRVTYRRRCLDQRRSGLEEHGHGGRRLRGIEAKSNHREVARRGVEFG